MARLVFEFTSVDRILIGTVGLPGEREFYLQVKGIMRGKATLASFALEKSQAAALADRALEILGEIDALRNLEGFQDAVKVPLSADDDLAPLETPIESEFALGVMSLTWLNTQNEFLFEAQAIAVDDSDLILDELVTEDSGDAPAILRLRVPPSVLLTFARRTGKVVAAGRQPCVFCGGPVNPGGHLCPRANGYRRQLG